MAYKKQDNKMKGIGMETYKCKFKRYLPLVAMVFFLLLPGVAFADSIKPWFGDQATAWTFHSYGNGFVIAEMLTAINPIVASPLFRNLFLGIATIGFLIAAGMGVMGNFTRAAGYFVALIVVIYSVFSVTVDIHVEERIYSSGSSNYARLVPGVPLALGLPFVLTSEIGYKITKEIEEKMSTPNNKTPPPLISEGMSFGSGPAAIKELSNTRITNPYFRKNFNEYVSECIIPKIHTGEINALSLINSTDIWKVLEIGKHKSVYTQLVNLDGSIPQYNGVETCEEAYGTLSNQIKVFTGSTGWLNRLKSTFTPNVSEIDRLVGSIVTSIAIPEVIKGMNNEKATGMALQAGLIEMYRGTHEYAAQTLGMDGAMLAINTEQARRAQQGGWYTTAVLFKDMSGYFYAVLQALIIGLSIFMVLLLIVPGYGSKVLGSYVKVVVWMMLWWPGLAITNYIMMLYYQSEMSSLGVAFNYSFNNLAVANAYTDKMIMATAFLATMVPAIMWGIVSGTAYALTSVLDRASGAGAAASAASKTAESSMGAGSVNMNTVSMNKWDTSWRNSSGFEGTQSHFGAAASTDTNYTGGQDFSVGSHAAKRTESLEAAQGYTSALANERQSATDHSITSQRVGQELSSTSLAWINSKGTAESGGTNISNSDDFVQGMAYLSSINEMLRSSDTVLDKETRGQLEKTAQQISIGLDASLGPDGGSGKLGGMARETWTKEQSEAIENVLSSDALKALEEGASIQDVMNINSKSTDGNVYSNMSTALQQGSHSRQHVDSDLLSTANTKLESYKSATAERKTAEETYRSSTRTEVTQGYDPAELAGDQGDFNTNKSTHEGLIGDPDSNQGLVATVGGKIGGSVDTTAVQLAGNQLTTSQGELDAAKQTAEGDLASAKLTADEKARHEALGKNDAALQELAADYGYGSIDGESSMRELSQAMQTDGQLRARVEGQLASYTGQDGRTYTPIAVGAEGVVYSAANANGGEDLFVGQVGDNESSLNKFASVTTDRETGALTMVVSDSNALNNAGGNGYLEKDAHGNYQATGEFMTLETSVTTGSGGGIEKNTSNLAGQKFTVQSESNWDAENGTAKDQELLNDFAEGLRGENINPDATGEGRFTAGLHDIGQGMRGTGDAARGWIEEKLNNLTGDKFTGVSAAISYVAVNGSPLGYGSKTMGDKYNTAANLVGGAVGVDPSSPYIADRMNYSRQAMDASPEYRAAGEEAYYSLRQEYVGNQGSDAPTAQYNDQTVANAVAYMAHSGREDVHVMNHVNQNYLEGQNISARDLYDSASATSTKSMDDEQLKQVLKGTSKGSF